MIDPVPAGAPGPAAAADGNTVTGSCGELFRNFFHEQLGEDGASGSVPTTRQSDSGSATTVPAGHKTGFSGAPPAAIAAERRPGRNASGSGAEPPVPSVLCCSNRDNPLPVAGSGGQSQESSPASCGGTSAGAPWGDVAGSWSYDAATSHGCAAKAACVPTDPSQILATAEEQGAAVTAGWPFAADPSDPAASPPAKACARMPGLDTERLSSDPDQAGTAPAQGAHITSKGNGEESSEFAPKGHPAPGLADVMAGRIGPAPSAESAWHAPAGGAVGLGESAGLFAAASVAAEVQTGTAKAIAARTAAAPSRGSAAPPAVRPADAEQAASGELPAGISSSVNAAQASSALSAATRGDAHPGTPPRDGRKDSTTNSIQLAASADGSGASRRAAPSAQDTAMPPAVLPQNGQQQCATSAAPPVTADARQAAPGSRVPADSGHNAGPDIAPIAPRDADSAPAAPVVVQSARVLERMGQTEMRVGVNSASFGNIEVRASVQQDRVGAAIATSHTELRAAMAVEMPSLERAMEQHQLRLAAFDLGAHTGSRDSGSAAQQRAPSEFRTPSGPATLRFREAEPGQQGTVSPAWSPPYSSGLNVHA